jgi:hypothetical protein
VSGFSWELGNTLSAEAENNLAKAADYFEKIFPDEITTNRMIQYN